MAKPSASTGFTVAGLLFLLILFIWVQGKGPALSTIGASYSQYNPSGSIHTLKSVGANGANPTMTLNGGSVPWQTGTGYQSFSINYPTGGLAGSWSVTLSNNYVFQTDGGSSGTVFLNNANNAQLWAIESAQMGGTNPFQVKTAGQNQSWYINRYYFTVNMQFTGASLNIQCITTCTTYSGLGSFSNQGAYDTAFTLGVGGAIGNINTVMHLSSPTSLSLQLNMPPLLGGQTGKGSGILAAWTGPPCTSNGPSGGIGVGSLCETGCGSSGTSVSQCSIVQSQVHNVLKLYTDSGTTMPYYPAYFNPQIGLGNYTVPNLSSLGLSQTVYSKIDLTDFGGGFITLSPGTQCQVVNPQGCYATVQPQAVMTVLLDVATPGPVVNAPTPPPQTGTNAGALTGQVIDASSGVLKLGVGGAQVCLTDISQCSPVNSVGNFTLSNVPAGTHSLTVTAPSFNTLAGSSVTVSTGTVTNLGQIALQPLNPWYSGNLCVNSGIFSFLGPQLCIPYFVIFGLFGLAALAIYLLIAPRRKAISAASSLLG